MSNAFTICPWYAWVVIGNGPSNQEDDMSEKQYLDVNAEDFGAEVVKLVDEQRALYQMEKELKAKIVAAVNAKVTLPGGQTVAAVCWTRWGQMQVIVAEKAAPKATKARGNLADFLAAQGADGHAA